MRPREGLGRQLRAGLTHISTTSHIDRSYPLLCSVTRPWPGHSASSTTYLSLSTSTYGPWLRRGASAGKGLGPGLTAVATHPSLPAGRMERLVWRVLRSTAGLVTYLNAIAGVITVGNAPDAQPFAAGLADAIGQHAQAVALRLFPRRNRVGSCFTQERLQRIGPGVFFELYARATMTDQADVG